LVYDAGTVTPNPRKSLWADYLGGFDAGAQRQRQRRRLNTSYQGALGAEAGSEPWKNYLSMFGGGQQRQMARQDLRGNAAGLPGDYEPKPSLVPDVWKQYLSTLQAGDPRQVARGQLRTFYGQAQDSPDDKQLVQQYLSLFPSGDLRQAARQDFYGRGGDPLVPPDEVTPPDGIGDGGGGDGGGGGEGEKTNWARVLRQLGLPLDAMFENTRNTLRSNRDMALMAARNEYDTGKSNAELQNLMANRAIDENMAARGLFGSGIERRDERLQNQSYTSGLLGLLQGRDLSTMQAKTGYHSGMAQAVLELAARSMQDPYIPIPDWYSWMKDNPVA